MPHDPTQRRQATRDALVDAAIVAVIRERDERRLMEIIEGLLEGGIRALEITVPTPGWSEALRSLEARGLTRTVCIGAGTVCSEEDVARARDAGAAFLVSPHTDPRVIAATVRAGCVAIPGALTPTEIVFARNSGADFVKVFPVSAVGGPRYVRLVRGPLPDIPLWVSGSVLIDDIEEHLVAGAQLVGLTSALTSDLPVEGARAAIAARVASANEAVARVRRGRVLLTIQSGGTSAEFKLDDLLALPDSERTLLEAVLPDRRGQAVRARVLLKAGGVPEDCEVEVTSADGSFRRTMSAKSLFEGGFLHYATAGQPLDRALGGPLRLYVVGGASGCDNVKGLSQIRVI